MVSRGSERRTSPTAKREPPRGAVAAGTVTGKKRRAWRGSLRREGRGVRRSDRPRANMFFKGCLMEIGNQEDECNTRVASCAELARDAEMITKY